jgi:hypothetical protein
VYFALSHYSFARQKTVRRKYGRAENKQKKQRQKTSVPKTENKSNNLK